jgi:3,4-dihydroxyphenylacetate 2,3-dioxygenase
LTNLDATAPLPLPPFDIVRFGHAELVVQDLDRSLEFYCDSLGFVLTERTSTHAYLRGLEERIHHSLALKLGAVPAVTHVAFRVRTDQDLDRAAEFCHSAGLACQLVAAGDERGQGPALRFSDPFGFTVELFYAMDAAERQLQRFELYRGATPMRIDHLNLFVPDVASAHRYYTEQLGFHCSEYTETAADPPQVWASWLYRKPSVHDVALMNGAGPRVHHLGFWVPDQQSVLRACDILAAKGEVEALERGPGRHGISNAFFLYLRDPDGHRIELYSGDYLTADPDFEPIRWRLDDPRRQTFWGHSAPLRWFTEASSVLSIDGSVPVATVEPTLADRPDTVT